MYRYTLDGHPEQQNIHGRGGTPRRVAPGRPEVSSARALFADNGRGDSFCFGVFFFFLCPPQKENRRWNRRVNTRHGGTRVVPGIRVPE